MKKLLLVALVASLPFLAFAKKPPSYDESPNEAQLVEHGHYTNKKGQDVHSPAHTKDGKAPAGATAKCRDGTYSFSKSHRGTCSRHGGVAEWIK